MSAYDLFLLLILGLLIAAALVLFLPAPRSRTQPAPPADHQPIRPIFRDDDQYWYLGVFYYNPDDPDPFIPKRYGIGWTVNFAHPVGRLVLVVMFVMILLPVALALFFPGLNSSFGCHPSGCHLAP